MTGSRERIDAYLEIGKRRLFVGVIDWPGWCRSGRDEASALHALLDYGPRYVRVLQRASIELDAPADISLFSVVERLDGDATTDFGAPGAIPAADAKPLGEADLQRLQRVLEGCWLAFDAAVELAAGTELRKGPRGGGRDLEGIVQHVVDADASYLGRLGQKYKKTAEESAADELAPIRSAILDGLASAARGDLAARGPRGGVRWPPRYFVRRVAWHVLDHAWEIEDRIT